MHNPVCRLCRREQKKLFLKGERCLSPKCSVTKRPYPPGQAGQTRPGKQSDYNRQLRAKQCAKNIYGIRETQFKKYYLEAAKTMGKTGETLLQILERRLDNVIYRLGFAFSRSQAKQFISHKKISINGKMLNIPSYLVKEKDAIELIDKGKKINKKIDLPTWLKLDSKNNKAEVVKLPTRDEIESDIEDQLIVEFYSR